jgi:hypothetical protein
MTQSVPFRSVPFRSVPLVAVASQGVPVQLIGGKTKMPVRVGLAFTAMIAIRGTHGCSPSPRLAGSHFAVTSRVDVAKIPLDIKIRKR